MEPRELMTEAETRVLAGKFEEAIPFLEALIEKLGKSDEVVAKRVVDRSRFFLACCYMEMARLNEAQDAFDRYLKEFPQGAHRKEAYMYLAETLARQENWTQVVVRLKMMMDEGGLITPELRLTVNQMVGDALFRLKRWSEAIDPLIFVFQNSNDLQMRNGAASMAAMAMLESEAHDKLFGFVPMVYRTGARYDVAMNLALLEGGDKLYDKGQFTRALMLFRLIYFKDDLIKHLTSQINTVKSEIERLSRPGTMTRQDLMAQRNFFTRLLPALEQQLTEVSEVEQYDYDVMMRLGRTYAQLQRHEEALLLFRHVYEAGANKELAHLGLYAVFMTLMEMGEADRMIETGYEYMKLYPTTQEWNFVTMLLAQEHLKRNEWDKVIELSVQALTTRQDHMFRDYLMMLSGICHFFREDFQAAHDTLGRALEANPKSEYAYMARYWRILSLMFMERFADAMPMLQQYLADHTEQNEYYMDAMFRLAMSQYGLDRFVEAGETLRKFVEKYPDRELSANAFSMLADILASQARLDEAILLYKRARDVTVHYAQTHNLPVKMFYVTYPTIQIARVLELESKFADIIPLMQEYLDTWGDKGNFTEATYWLGTAKTRLGRTDEAHDHFMQVVVRFGNDPKLSGVDMILRDLIYASESPRDPEEFAAFLDRLYGEINKARANRQRTLELRLITLFAQVERNKDRRASFMRSIMRDDNIPVAGPLTLDLMGRHALAEGKPELAERVYNYFMKTYPDSDLAVNAFKWSVDHHIARKKFDQARTLLAEVAVRWGHSSVAGWAKVREADLYRLENNCEEAIKLYNLVVTTRDWKGELWPESLYKIGLCHFQDGKWAEANAFFERIIVVFEAYEDWLARAYLKSAECLEKLGRSNLAITALEEMLSKPSLTHNTETSVARKELARLTGRPAP